MVDLKNSALFLMRHIFKLLGIVLIIGGWFCTGIGFTTTMGHPISTIMFLGGIIMMGSGVVTLFIKR